MRFIFCRTFRTQRGICLASPGVKAAASQRQRQLPPPMVPGVLMRPSLPRPSQSAMGTTASRAGLCSTPRRRPAVSPSFGGKAQIFPCVAFFLCACGAPPSPQGGVVVRARVCHAVLCVVVRQMVAIWARAERKLQHLHAGKARLFQQRAHAFEHLAQILRHNGRTRQSAQHLTPQPHARPLPPLPLPRIGRAVGDGVIGVKPAEVVDAHGVI